MGRSLRTNAKTSRRALKITALFAGVGGLELGLKRAGHRVSLMCEIDPQAIAVLRRRFPNVAIVEDVRNRAELLRAISPSSDLLTAGFPCADLSQAGSKGGLNAGQSGLVREVLKLLASRPFDHVLLENVPNWRRLHGGRHMREVLRSLERLGYRWAYRTVDAQAFGLPQRRPRIFVYATKIGDPRAVLFPGDEAPRNGVRALNEAAHGFYWTEGRRGVGWGEDCVPALKGGSGIGIPSAPAILLTDGKIVTPGIRDAERLQGLPPGWTQMSRSRGPSSAARAAERRRLTLVGNAVNARVATWLGRRLRNPMSLAGPAGKPLRKTDSLPPAAWYDGRRCYSATIGPWPVARPAVDLQEFLKYPGKPLSRRATAGFLGRLSASTRLRPSRAFLRRLEAHVRSAPA